MPGILKDRFIVTLLLIIVAALCACLFFYAWQLSGSTHVAATPSPVPADNSDGQAISIAMNDTAVAGKLQEAWYTMGMATNGDAGDSVPFNIGGVVMSSFHGADIDSPAMPAVEVDVGDSSDAGINIYAFVDLQKDRVAYIGFAPRPGNNANGMEYSTTDHGLAVYSASMDSTSYLYNVTIVDTGYSGSANLTDQNKADIVHIALENGTISGRLDGRKYDTSVMMAGQEDSYHIISYPVVRFTVYKKDSDGIDFYLFAAVDAVNNRISTTESSMPDIQPPQFPVS